MADNKGSLPPPSSRGRRGPEMAEEKPSVVNKLSQLAGAGGDPNAGQGMGDETQSLQLLMQGAQMMKAAQMNPKLQQIVMPALQMVQQGLGGGGAGDDQMGGGGMRRMGPPQAPGAEAGGMSPQPGAEEGKFSV